MGRRELLVAAAATAGLGIIGAILTELERRCRRGGEGRDTNSAPDKSHESSAGRGSAPEACPNGEAPRVSAAASGAGASGAAISSSAGLAGLSPSLACLLPSGHASSVANVNGASDGTHNVAGVDLSSQQLLGSLALQASGSKQARGFWNPRGAALDSLRQAPGMDGQRSMASNGSASSSYTDLVELPAGGAVGARADPMQKVRLDQLFRYLDARQDQDAHQSQQRQRLQRKLLQRNGGRPTEVDNGSLLPARAIEAGAEQDRLQDSREMEELLKELGESPTTPKGRRRQRAKRGATRASPQSRGSGRNFVRITGSEQTLEEVTSPESPPLVISPARSAEASPVASPVLAVKLPWPPNHSEKSPPIAEKPVDLAPVIQAPLTKAEKPADAVFEDTSKAIANSQKAPSPGSKPPKELKELKDAALAESIRRVLAVGPPPEPPPEPPEPSPEPPPTHPEGPVIKAGDYSSADFEEWLPGDTSHGVQGFQVVANRKSRRKRDHREQNGTANAGSDRRVYKIHVKQNSIPATAGTSAERCEEVFTAAAGPHTSLGTEALEGDNAIAHVVTNAGSTIVDPGNNFHWPEDATAAAVNSAVSADVAVYGQMEEFAIAAASSTISSDAPACDHKEALGGEHEQLDKEGASAGAPFPSQPSTPATFSVDSVVSVTDSAPGSSSLTDSAAADLEITDTQARREAEEARIEAVGNPFSEHPLTDSHGNPCASDGSSCRFDFRTAENAVDGSIQARLQDEDRKCPSGRNLNLPSRRRNMAENVSPGRSKQLWADMSDDEEDFPSMQEMGEYSNFASSACDNVA